MNIAISLIAAAALLGGCTSTLQKVNEDLGQINRAMGGNPSPSAGTAAPSISTAGKSAPGAQISREQEQTILQSLATKNSNTALNQAVAEASQNISGFIKISSCQNTYGRGSRLNIYGAPGRDFSYADGVMMSMPYHDKSRCLSVLRLQGWDMPAKNALRFEVVYVSDSSGESQKRNHELVKQPTGEWLFTR